MKVIIFLCLALIATYHTVAAVSRAEILSLLQQDYSIDKVLQLFQALQAQEKSDLSDLDSSYEENHATFEAEITRTTDLLNKKVDACGAIDKQVQQGTAQEDKLKANIKDAQDTIESNEAKSKAAADARCAANLLFISELGNREEAVEFLTYLRGRVADPAFADYLTQQGGAFLQLKSALAARQENEILSLIAKHHMISMLQNKGKKQDYEGESDLSGKLTATVRTSDEVGTDYQDNDKGALTVQGINDDSLSVADYVQKILGYIDQLIASLKGDVTKLQDVETQAVQAFIEYRRQLKDQNYVLQQYIDSANKALTDLESVDENNSKAAEQCKSEVTDFEKGVQAAKDNDAAYEQAYEQRKANLVDTLALLKQVIDVYTQEVVNVAPDSYKARADDYLDDQTFNTTADFTARTEANASA